MKPATRKPGHVLTGVLLTAVLIGLLAPATAGAAGDETTGPQPARHRISGLFSPDRQQDLRAVIQDLPGVGLLSLDYPTAEALLVYDAAERFPNATPEQVVQRLDHLLRQASRHTFGVRPLPAMDPDRLQRVEIPVAGLDCKGCALAAYEAVYQIEGVQRTTVSFQQGQVSVWIDPAKTGRASLEAALMKKGVALAGAEE